VLIRFEDRPSDSPLVERVWRSHSQAAGTFQSMASCHWMMVVTRHRGKTFFTIRGPETKATVADCPAGGDWVGVHFKLGTFMPLLRTAGLRDRNDLTLPQAGGRSFWLYGSAWEYPSFENIDTFVHRLVKRGLIAKDPGVEAALEGRPQPRSRRTEQRHILQVTGMTQASIRQIARAREATRLLTSGAPLLRVTHDLGYFDQAHMTRSLKRFIGQTPAQIARGEQQLSLLYNSSER